MAIVSYTSNIPKIMLVNIQADVLVLRGVIRNCHKREGGNMMSCAMLAALLLSFGVGGVFKCIVTRRMHKNCSLRGPFNGPSFGRGDPHEGDKSTSGPGTTLYDNLSVQMVQTLGINNHERSRIWSTLGLNALRCLGIQMMQSSGAD